ncbi:hypothetical protein BHE74_00042344 [Ensete ventricosum]|uniref:60S ribosomal protein L13a n=1 Tax=Ensete ventricosum TaxID=4639 RepID=A0A445MET7_ENSVE|nr:hypothetical protein BHE74_00042344 [Ensete ventricosum]RZR72780.1 hypothetical protein BHM03_00016942 [Ensete ventricosum]
MSAGSHRRPRKKAKRGEVAGGWSQLPWSRGRSMVCARWVVVVDAHHHLLGRLASILKELLNGQRVVVVYQKMKYLRFLRKLMNTM